MTSDSISARPMIMARRIAPAAVGFLAMPSQADEMAQPCPIAPAAAAMPRTNAAEMTPHFTPPAPPPAGTCANADAANRSVAPVISMILLFTPNSSFPRTSDLVFFRRDGAADVDHRQHDEDERLQERAENTETHHRPGDHERDETHENPGRGVLAEDVAEQTDAE